MLRKARSTEGQGKVVGEVREMRRHIPLLNVAGYNNAANRRRRPTGQRLNAAALSEPASLPLLPVGHAGITPMPPLRYVNDNIEY